MIKTEEKTKKQKKRENIGTDITGVY